MSKKQFGKRLLQILIVLIGVSFFTFGLTYLSPGDPAEIMLTECGNLPTPELLEQTRHELGLDQPFLVQYGSWVKGVLTGDMGTSYAFKVPVTEKLMKCFWPTLQMSLFALLLMILFSIPCGILSAVYQNKWPDYLIRGITFFGVSIPSFWIGLILLSIFGVQLRWINVAGGTTDFKAMILPSVTLAQIYQTGTKRSAGRTQTGLCHWSQNERDQRKRDPLETCTSKRNASYCNTSWSFPRLSARRNSSC